MFAENDNNGVSSYHIASFRLPETGDLFSAIEFPELNKEEAQKLVTKYNKEGWNAGYGRAPSSRGGPRGGRGPRGFRPMPSKCSHFSL